MAYNSGLIDLQLLGFFKEEADKAYTNKLEGVKVNGEELSVDEDKNVNVDLKSYATVKDLEALREQVGSFGHVQGSLTTQELRDLKNGLTPKGTVWANSDEHGVLYMYVGVGAPGADPFGLIYLGNAIDPGDFATKAALQSHMDYAESRLAEKANRSWTDTYFVRKTQADELYIKREDLDGILSEDALEPYLKKEDAQSEFASKDDLTKVHGLIKGDCLKRELDSKKEDALVGDVWIVLDESNTAYYFDGKNFAAIGAEVDLREYAKLTDLRSYATSSELNNYLTKNAAESLYASKADFETHKNNAWNTYATKDELAKKFGDSVNRAELDAYLTTEAARENYLSKQDAINDYVDNSDLLSTLNDYLKRDSGEYAKAKDLEDLKASLGPFGGAVAEKTGEELTKLEEKKVGDVYFNTDNRHYYAYVGADVPGADDNGFIDLGESVGPADFATREEMLARGLGSGENYATKQQLDEGLAGKADADALEALEEALKTLNAAVTEVESLESVEEPVTGGLYHCGNRYYVYGGPETEFVDLGETVECTDFATRAELESNTDDLQDAISDLQSQSTSQNNKLNELFESQSGLKDDLAKKADQSAVDRELKDVKAQLGAFNSGVGETDTAGMSDLKNSAKPGDLFRNTDDDHYYAYVGPDVPGTNEDGFIDLGESVGPGDFATRAELEAKGLGSAENYVTDDELQAGLDQKADKKDLEALKNAGGVFGSDIPITDDLQGQKETAQPGDVFKDESGHYQMFVGEESGAGEDGFVDLGESFNPGDFATRPELDTKADKSELEELKKSLGGFGSEATPTDDLSQEKENAEVGDVFLDSSDGHYKEYVGEGSPGADPDGFVDLGDSVGPGDYATRPELEALKEELTSKTGELNSLQADLDKKAPKDDFDALEGKVNDFFKDSENSSLKNIEDGLAGKADQSALTDAVDSLTEQIGEKAPKAEFDNLKQKLEDDYTNTTDLNGLLNAKADQDALDSAKQELNDAIGLKADQEDLEHLLESLGEYTNTADLTDLLEGKADKTQILDWLLKTEAQETYLTKQDATLKYLNKQEASTTYVFRNEYTKLQDAVFKSGKMRGAITKAQKTDLGSIGIEPNSGDYFVITDDANHLFMYLGTEIPGTDHEGFIDLGTHVDLSNYVQSSVIDGINTQLADKVSRSELEGLQNLLNFSVATEDDINALFTA